MIEIRQPPTFPCRLQHSIIGRPGLNHRVRDVDGCFPWAHRHRKSLALNEKLASSFRDKLVRFASAKSNFLIPYSSALVKLLLSFLNNSTVNSSLLDFLRKEVIQPHLPIRLPCYDFTPVIEPAFGSSLLTVGSLTSGIPNSHGVTGGVYKTRERIHRSILICDY